ncbi:MAG: class I SAM-dependent methyltransferase [Jhaorihella sp.]
MARGIAFWNVLAKRYSRQKIADPAAYERKLDSTRRHLFAQADVLEFGCGTGSTALLHAPHVRSIRAIDYSGRMIAIARAKAAEQGIGNVSFEVAELGWPDEPDNSYDVVLGLNILHLLPDWETAVGKVFALLRPGGVFVSTTACLEGTMRPMRPVFFVAGALGLLPRVMFISEDRLVDTITGAGFELAERWSHANGRAVFLVARKPA